MPHHHWGKPEFDIQLPHTRVSGNGASNGLRGSSSAPTIHKTSSRIKVPLIVQKGGVGNFHCESHGHGRYSWNIAKAKEDLPREMHADNRPSRVQHVCAEPYDVAME